MEHSTRGVLKLVRTVNKNYHCSIQTNCIEIAVYVIDMMKHMVLRKGEHGHMGMYYSCLGSIMNVRYYYYLELSKRPMFSI